MGQCCNRNYDIKKEHERNMLKELEQQKEEKITIIKKFVLKNIESIKIRKNYQNKLSISESLFNNKITDRYFNEQNYYKEKFANKLKEIMDQKKIQFFNELFPGEILQKITTFDCLRDFLGNYYNDDIYENQINFYIHFANLMKKDEIIHKTYTKKIERKSLNSNFMNFMAKNSKENKFDNLKNFTGFGALNFNDINLNKEQKYIKKDIDVLYKYCFNIGKLPNLDVCQKRCKSLSLILDNSDIHYKKLNVSTEFINFIKSLYYIILLKKSNCLSNTGENIFFAINKKKTQIDLEFKESDENLLREHIQEDIKKDSSDHLGNMDNKDNEDSKNNLDNIDNKIIFQSKKTLNSKNRKRDILTFTTLMRNNTLKSTYHNSNANTELSTNNNDNYDTSIFNKYKNNIISTINYNSTKTSNNTSSYNQIIKKPTTRRQLSRTRLKTVIEKNPEAVLKNIKTADSIKLLINPKKFKNTEKEYYSGQYDNTTYLYSGFGTLIEPDKKSSYTGTFRYGVKEGMGVLLEEPNSSMMKCFSGEFKNNKIEGYGMKIYLKSNIFIFKEGLFSGKTFLQGKVKIIRDNILKDEIDIIKYEGEISKDAFDGFGTLVQKTYMKNNLSNYDFVYEKEYKGHFKNGKENGKGIMTYNNAITQENYKYSGNFVDGIRDGYGVINYGENFFIKKYEGIFKEDKPFSTYGIAYFKSGDIYEGFFDTNHRKDFVGNYSFYDTVSKIINENYFGGFLDDAKQGLGTIYCEKKEGSKLLKGNFNMGDKQGCFEMNEYKNELVKRKINHDLRRKRMTSWNFGELYENKYERNQKKLYILFEQNEIMEKSEFPFDDS